MKTKRIFAFLMLVIIIFSYATGYTADEFANRGEVAAMLLEAADFYNPDVVKSDIIKGYEDGLLHEERYVTRAEALVMLSRAFEELPKPTGHNKRVALTKEDFTDIPAWAEIELAQVFDSGIVAGTGQGKFSPDNRVTKKQMELFIERAYALYGTNPKDDFYASINKTTLDELEIISGNLTAGTLENLQIEATSQVDFVIEDIIVGNHKYGTSGQKVTDLFKCIVDSENRNSQGINPIKKYLNMIDDAKNISELTNLEYVISDELCVSSFMGFSLGVDMKDSSRYVLNFGTMTPLMNKEFYFEEGKNQEAYIEYLTTLLEIGGEDSVAAMQNALEYFELEKLLASEMLDTEGQNDINKMYTLSSYGKICAMYPDFNMEKVLSYSGLSKADKVYITDIGMAEKFAEIYNQSNFNALKTTMKLSVLYSCGGMLSGDFKLAAYKFESIVMGAEGFHDVYQDAVNVIKSVMPEYISKSYVEKFFDEESKKDVEEMTYDIIGVFKKRIDNLTWMSRETKEKAKLKLDKMNVKIGYPDSMDSFIDNVDVIPREKGGTYFSNMTAISKENRNQLKGIQQSKVDHGSWGMTPYTVNAVYNPSNNEIVLPAAILQAPLYDKDAAYEENLGGIGYVIAHEITHAFDPNGAQFDEYGNVNNWWTAKDYEMFEFICRRVEEFYQGEEPIPAVQTNGKLTRNENIADIGGVSCITQLAMEKGHTNYNKLYTSVAKTWAGTFSREYAEYLSKVDVHSSGKIRVNRVLVNFPEFYEAFDIQKGDGMYVPPEERIKIW